MDLSRFWIRTVMWQQTGNIREIYALNLTYTYLYYISWSIMKRSLYWTVWKYQTIDTYSTVISRSILLQRTLINKPIHVDVCIYPKNAINDEAVIQYFSYIEPLRTNRTVEHQIKFPHKRKNEYKKIKRAWYEKRSSLQNFALAHWQKKK